MRFLPHQTATRVLLASTLVASVLTATTAIGDDVARSRKALLLKVGNYPNDGDIPNADVDAKAIGDVLEKRYRFALTTPEFSQFSGVKSKTNGWVNALKNGDERPEQLVVYYRGYLHVSGGQAWLTDVAFDPRDVDQKHLYSVAELARSLSSVPGCPLASVFLDVVCDTAPEEITSAVNSAVAPLGSGATPVAIYAAATRRSDPTWSTMKQSRMSFWLVDGLKGSAVKPAGSADGHQPDVVLRRLTAHTTDKLGKKASTVFAQSAATTRNAVVSPTRAKTLDEQIRDMALQAATQLRENNVKTVVVPDFVVSGGDDRSVPGEDYGPLLRYISTKFKAQLSSESFGAFSIADSVFVREILQENRINPENIRQGRMRDLRKELKEEIANPGVLAILLGGVEHGGVDPGKPGYREGPSVLLTCRPNIPVVEDEDAILLAAHDGRAMLNTSEWSMIGHSAVNQTVAARYVNAPQAPGAPAKTIKRIDKPQAAQQRPNRRPSKIHSLLDYFDQNDVDQVRREIEELQKDAKQRHPLTDANFPWRISLKVGGEDVKVLWSKDERHAYSEIAIGNTYTIGIENRSDKPVFLRLLVDGLNTLPDTPLLEKADSGDGKFEVAVKDRGAGHQPAQHVNLTNARAWYCEPKTDYEVQGFFTKIEAEGKADKNAEGRKFVVTDARSSEAARKDWTKDIGIVTAAFYVPRERPVTMAAGASRGTKMGEEFNQKVETYTGNMVPGELLGVVHLRYGITRENEKSIESGQVALK